MKYRNRRTGAVIDTSSRISGGDWEEVPVAPAQPKNEEKAESAAHEKVTASATKKTAAKTTAKKAAAKKSTGRK